jgi:hypothetical protein
MSPHHATVYRYPGHGEKPKSTLKVAVIAVDSKRQQKEGQKWKPLRSRRSSQGKGAASRTTLPMRSPITITVAHACGGSKYPHSMGCSFVSTRSCPPSEVEPVHCT